MNHFIGAPAKRVPLGAESIRLLTPARTIRPDASTKFP
jgi:hypothetical protein